MAVLRVFNYKFINESLTKLDPKLDRYDAYNQNGWNDIHIVPEKTEVFEPGMIHLSHLVSEEVYAEEVEDSAEYFISGPEGEPRSLID